MALYRSFNRSYRKRSTYRRKMMRKKPFGIRRRMIAKPMVMPRLRHRLSVKRTCFVGTITPASTTTASFWNYVTPSLASAGTICGTTLGGLNNVAEYQALFDQYKLAAVKLSFKPRYVDVNLNQINPSSGTSTTDRQFLSYVIDTRGTTTISGTYGTTSYNQFTETGKVKIRRGDKEVSIYIKPKINEQFGGGANRYVSPKFADMDSNGLAIPHRGVYIYHHTQNTLSSGIPTFGAYDVFATYYLTFIGMK